MSSPIDLLRRGLQSSNWSLVSQSFKLLTGETILPPEGDFLSPSAKRFLEKLSTDINEFLAGPVYVSAAPPIEDEEEDIDEPVPVNVRRESKAEAQPQPPHRATDASLDKFHHTHGKAADDVREDGKKRAKPVPFEPGSYRNAFVDDGSLAKGDIAIDKKLTNGLEPSERRPEVKLVDATCSKCGKKEEIPAGLASRTVGDDDDGDSGFSYVCNKCIPKSRRN